MPNAIQYILCFIFISFFFRFCPDFVYKVANFIVFASLWEMRKKMFFACLLCVRAASVPCKGVPFGAFCDRPQCALSARLILYFIFTARINCTLYIMSIECIKNEFRARSTFFFAAHTKNMADKYSALKLFLAGWWNPTRLAATQKCRGKRLTHRVYCSQCNYTPEIIADDAFLGKSSFFFVGTFCSAALTLYVFSVFQKKEREERTIILHYYPKDFFYSRSLRFVG